MLESEFIERAVAQEFHAAATPEQIRQLGLRTAHIGSALVSVGSELPASAILINRALGLGLSSPETEQSVREIVGLYRACGVNRYFVHVHPDAGPGQLVEWLVTASLVKARGWQKFVRGREAVPAVRTDLRVTEIGPEYGAAFGRIAADAFDLGPAAAPWLARLPGRPGWHVFMSFAGDEPAGCGALFVRDGFGWTDFGATAPKFRQRGSQGAVLARRIECALDLGCKQIYTCTGEAVPGDPQHSFRNIEKLGFRQDYVRKNYAPPP